MCRGSDPLLGSDGWHVSVTVRSDDGREKRKSVGPCL